MQLLVEQISADRFSTYLIPVGYDPEPALRLYIWNMRISASFYPLLSAIEVCLRNRIQPRIAAVYGTRWWHDSSLHGIMGGRGKGIMLKTEKQIAKRASGVSEYSVSAGQMTAELNFGFWSNMLLPKYEPHLWQPIKASFPNMPHKASLSDLHQRIERVKELRNRISHHEHLLKRPLTEDYSNAMEVLKWLSPEMAEWIRPNLDTMSILREKP